jgi:hypothetical protein
MQPKFIDTAPPDAAEPKLFAPPQNPFAFAPLKELETNDEVTASTTRGAKKLAGRSCGDSGTDCHDLTEINITDPAWNETAAPNRLEAKKKLPLSDTEMLGKMKTL